MTFSLLGIISVVLEHPLLITVFTRFLLCHVPVNFLCNIIILVVLLRSFSETNDARHSLLCSSTPVDPQLCDAFALMQRVAWLYVFILLPATIAQLYAYIIFRRFILVADDDGAVTQQQSEDNIGSQQTENPLPQRRLTIKHPISRGGRRRGKALWFSVENPDQGPGDSFLPSMIISPPKNNPWPPTQIPSIPDPSMVSPPIRTPKDLEKILHQKKIVPKASFTSAAKESSIGGSRNSQDLDFLELGNRSNR
ncbi:hypothetical protein M422DRAFT_241816 [Sphaerobolus stellatus SS14]|nr:hypothetical protein M422DRAFT_241816 [Sphaerobolus stellatus SS14]